MKQLRAFISALFVLPLAGGAARAEIDFVKDIKPILEQTCVRCHSGPKAKGGLSLESKEAMLKGGNEGEDVVVPGKAAGSRLFKAVIAPKDDDTKMPPEGDRLAKNVTDKLKAWIDEGAKWPEGVVLKAPKQDGPKVAVDDPGLPISPAEKAAVEKLEKAGVFVMRLAQNTNLLRVDFANRGKEVKDDELLLLKDMPNLVELNLGGQNIADANLVHLKPLTNLVRLQLHRTKITDAGLANLAGLTKLNSLNLYDTGVTDQGIQQLKDCKALKRLYVWQSKVTESGAKELAAAIPGIDINRGYELPPEPKKEEGKAEEPKKETPKKNKKDKKDPAAKVDPKKEEPKKEEPKKDEPKKDEPKK